MTPSGSPTVRRRRLAAELRRLRGNRTGNEVSRAIGWSATKISRAESGRESLPPAEVEKLIDYYGVTDPLRGRLLGLAEDAVQRGWWDDYAEALTPEYLEFIGLEAEAMSCLQWQSDVIPGLLQTEDYARRLGAAFRAVDPTVTPIAQERFLRVRMRRQARLTEEPVLQFSIVIDEAVLLRGVGDRGVMRAQLAHLADAAELPNVDLRVLPLNQNAGLHGSSFTIVSFGSAKVPEATALGDVVSTENMNTALYVEGDTGTYLYRLFFQALAKAALPSEESRLFIISTMKRTWSLPSASLSRLASVDAARQLSAMSPVSRLHSGRKGIQVPPSAGGRSQREIASLARKGTTKVGLMRFFTVRGRRRSGGDSPGSWKKSSLSSYNANCVEVAGLSDDAIRVRDSKNPRGGVLNFTPAEWDAFVGGVRKGEFDRKPRG